MSDDYESERMATRLEAATVLSGVVDGLLAGSLRLGEGDQAVSIDAPEELSLEVELETEDGEVSLELELEWPEDAEASGLDVSETDPDVSETGSDVSETGSGRTALEDATANPETDTAAGSSGADTGVPADQPATTESSETETGAADDSQSLARFELFEDRGGEWRWRLRHRNGNIIATSGEGYTRKHNAKKGLRSVVRNAPGAAHAEQSER